MDIMNKDGHACMNRIACVNQSIVCVGMVDVSVGKRKRQITQPQQKFAKFAFFNASAV